MRLTKSNLKRGVAVLHLRPQPSQEAYFFAPEARSAGFDAFCAAGGDADAATAAAAS